MPTVPNGLLDLDISHTNISVIPSLPANLERLDISYTPINSLPILPYTLINLDILNTGINQVTANDIVLNLYTTGQTFGELHVSSTIDTTTYNYWNKLVTDRNWIIDLVV